jgi:hypothetical protein
VDQWRAITGSAGLVDSVFAWPYFDVDLRRARSGFAEPVVPEVECSFLDAAEYEWCSWVATFQIGQVQRRIEKGDQRAAAEEQSYLAPPMLASSHAVNC